MTAARQPEHGEATAHIADLLREAIVRGDFTPGARVRQEQIAELTGASRAPVREALRMLAAEGLVTLVANSGARVSSLSLPECEEIYRVRERVEPLLLRMSAPALDESELDRLGALAEEMAQAADARGVPGPRPRVPSRHLRRAPRRSCSATWCTGCGTARRRTGGSTPHSWTSAPPDRP